MLVLGCSLPLRSSRLTVVDCRLVQLLSASVFGADYWRWLVGPMEALPFVVVAAGLTLQGFIPWLNEGYDAVALGRELVQQG